MGVLKPMPLVYQNVGFFKVLYPMNEECIMKPAWAFQSTEDHNSAKSQNKCVMDILDFFNAVGNSSEIQGSIREVVK